MIILYQGTYYAILGHIHFSIAHNGIPSPPILKDIFKNSNYDLLMITGFCLNNVEGYTKLSIGNPNWPKPEGSNYNFELPVMCPNDMLTLENPLILFRGEEMELIRSDFLGSSKATISIIGNFCKALNPEVATAWIEEGSEELLWADIKTVQQNGIEYVLQYAGQIAKVLSLSNASPSAIIQIQANPKIDFYSIEKISTGSQDSEKGQITIKSGDFPYTFTTLEDFSRKAFVCSFQKVNIGLRNQMQIPLISPIVNLQNTVEIKASSSDAFNVGLGIIGSTYKELAWRKVIHTQAIWHSLITKTYNLVAGINTIKEVIKMPTTQFILRGYQCIMEPSKQDLAYNNIFKVHTSPSKLPGQNRFGYGNGHLIADFGDRYIPIRSQDQPLSELELEFDVKVKDGNTGWITMMWNIGLIEE